jgi:hypothetical protein
MAILRPRLLAPRLLFFTIVASIVGVQIVADVAHSDPVRAPYVVTLRVEGKTSAVRPVIRRLERQVKFDAKLRYDSKQLRGFSAKLTRKQVTRMKLQRGVNVVVPDPGRWIVLFDPTVPDADARIYQLERDYSFTATARYRELGGFAAKLSSRQLLWLNQEDDIILIGPNSQVRPFEDPAP